MTEPQLPVGTGQSPELPPSPPQPPAPLAPVAGTERVAEIDFVRGFALLGILLMNIEWFNRPLQGLQMGLDATLAGIDLAAGWTIMAFVQGKFYTLFSMLFGMGFAILLERANERGRRFGGFFARRLLVLMAIGAVHGFLIWPGDILFVYATVGFLLLLFFRRTPTRRLPKWGVALIFVPMLAFWAMVGSIELAKMGSPATYEKIVSEQSEARAELARDYDAAAVEWSTSSYLGLQTRRATDMVDQLAFLPVLSVILLGIFALGAWFVRSGTMLRPAEHLGFYRRWAALGLGLGAPLAVVAMLTGFPRGFKEMSWNLPLSATIMQAANLLLALGYLSALVLLVQSPAWRERLRPLAAAGRMALTNYLLQSLIATTLFYGYGFGLFGRVPRAWQVVLALAIYAVNLAFSTWWLARFRFGPAEWLWRTLTYGKLQPLRR